MLHVEWDFINSEVSPVLTPMMSNRSLRAELPRGGGSQPSWSWKEAAVILHPVYGCWMKHIRMHKAIQYSSRKEP